MCVMTVFCCWIKILFPCASTQHSISNFPLLIANRNKMQLFSGPKMDAILELGFQIYIQYWFVFQIGNVVVLNPFNWIAQKLFAIWPTQYGWMIIFCIFVAFVFRFAGSVNGEPNNLEPISMVMNEIENHYCSVVINFEHWKHEWRN